MFPRLHCNSLLDIGVTYKRLKGVLHIKALLNYATCLATTLEFHDQGCHTVQRFLQLVS